MDWLEPCRLLVGVHRIPAMFTLAFSAASHAMYRGEVNRVNQWQSVPHIPQQSGSDISSASVMTATALLQSTQTYLLHASTPRSTAAACTRTAASAAEATATRRQVLRRLTWGLCARLLTVGDR